MTNRIKILLYVCIVAFAIGIVAGIRHQHQADQADSNTTSGTGTGAALPTQVSAPKLTFVTYNVYDNVVDLKRRAPALLKMIGDLDADVIALQEITPQFVDLLVKCEWSAKYKGFTVKGEPVAHDELCILSKFPVLDIKYVSIPSRLQRAVLIASLDVNGRKLNVATTHLDSFLDDGPRRAKQLDAIFPMLIDADDAVLLGDFNFGEGEQPDTAHLDTSYVDVWLALHKGEPGFTWNIELSPMAARGSFPEEKSRRIDRILVRSRVWRPESVQILGTAPVDKETPVLFPSDHFGLVARVKNE